MNLKIATSLDGLRYLLHLANEQMRIIADFETNNVLKGEANDHAITRQCRAWAVLGLSTEGNNATAVIRCEGWGDDETEYKTVPIYDGCAYDHCNKLRDLNTKYEREGAARRASNLALQQRNEREEWVRLNAIYGGKGNG